MKRFIYLISPNEIKRKFYENLENVLSYGNVKFFQLRVKKLRKKNLIIVAKKIRKITQKHKVKLIINDDYSLVPKIGADGCHMGQGDGSFIIARKKLKKKVLGITCHDSIILAKKALKFKPDYLAFGSFFKSKLKPSAKIANLRILKEARNIKKPIVVIGGINNLNYKSNDFKAIYLKATHAKLISQYKFRFFVLLSYSF